MTSDTSQDNPLESDHVTSAADSLVEEPPADIKKEAESIPSEDIRSLLIKTDVFPRQLLALNTNPAPERAQHLCWVIRFWLAYPETGLQSFRGPPGQRKQVCKWAASETDTTFEQLQTEIRTVYAGVDEPQRVFREDLEAFEDEFRLMNKQT